MRVTSLPSTRNTRLRFYSDVKHFGFSTFCFKTSLEPLVPLGVFWFLLGASWVLLGASSVPPGRLLGAPGCILGASWVPPGFICGGLGSNKATRENLHIRNNACASHLTCATNASDSFFQGKAKRVHGTSGRTPEKERGGQQAVAPGFLKVDPLQGYIIKALQVRNFEGASSVVQHFLGCRPSDADDLLIKWGLRTALPFPARLLKWYSAFSFLHGSQSTTPAF